MAKGGARPGSGRKKGQGTRNLIRVMDYFTPAEVLIFFEDLKQRAKNDTKIALYLAEQMTGKAPQPVTDSEGGDLKIVPIIGMQIISDADSIQNKES